MENLTRTIIRPPTHFVVVDPPLLHVDGEGSDNPITYNKSDEHSPTTRKLTGHNLPKIQNSSSLRPQYPPTYTLPIESSETSLSWQKKTQYTKGYDAQQLQTLARRHSMQNHTKKQHEESKHLLSRSQTPKLGDNFRHTKDKQNLWKEHLDAHWDHMHNTHILWKTIHGLSNRAPPPPPTLNTSITFSNKITITPKHIANYFSK